METQPVNTSRSPACRLFQQNAFLIGLGKQWIVLYGQQRRLMRNKQKQKNDRSSGRRSRAARDINYGKAEKRVRGQKTIGLVAQSPLLTPTQETLWFNCRVLGPEFRQVQREKLRNLSGRSMRCIAIVSCRGRSALDSFIILPAFDCFLQFNCF